MSSIVGILESLDEVPVPASMPESRPSDSEDSADYGRLLKGLTPDEKAAKVWEYRMRGLPVNTLAKVFDVSSSTIYRWLEQHVENFRRSFENKPAANIIAESLLFLGKVREICMYEANQSDAESVTIDPATGEVIRSSKGNQSKVKFLDAAVRTEKTALDLMVTVGIIPKEPERIYHTLKGGKPDLDEAKKPDGRSDEEVRRDIYNLLAKGRRI